MTARPTVACIAGRRVVEVLAEMGLRTVLLDKDIPFESTLLADVPIEVNLDDWEATEAVLRPHHELQPLAAVLSVRDSYVPLAAYLAARLGVRGLALPAALNCGNKARLRYVLDGAGLPNARYAVVDELSQAGQAGDELGYPLVLKRLAGAGGAGVRLCRDRAELEAAAQLLSVVGTGIMQVLLEEYLDGPEFAVQTVTIDGVTEVVSILAERLGPPPHFAEVGYDFPAGLGSQLERTLTEYIVAVLAALGLDNGIAHVQLRLVDGVPKIVEVNPRPPGGRLDSLNEVVSGVDLVRALVCAALGRPLERSAPMATHARYRCVVFDRAGIVDYNAAVLSARYSDDDPSGSLISMDVNPGDMVLPLGHPDGGVYGRIVVFGHDVSELDEQCQRIEATLRLRVDSVPSATMVAGAGPQWW